MGWPWSALEEELGEDDDEGEGAAESASREEGLLLAPAILRFLRRGAELLNGRTDEGACEALVVCVTLVNGRREEILESWRLYEVECQG